jgi:PPM family protein phosphatase
MNFALRYAVRSDVGLLREGNEDSAYAGPHLLAVADGMGGYEAGEVASACVIQSVAPLDAKPMPDSELIDAIASAVTIAKQNLRGIVDADPAVGSMGTTLTAMLWSGETAAICHIGDSRAYLLRDGDLYQITRDHTFVQALIDQGRIRPNEAASHPQRSLLLRALDGRTDAEPDLSLLTAEVGDRYLLCSDGLPVVVSDEAILQTLADISDPGQAVLELIEQAIRGGGPDNITCIVADVIDSDRSQLPPTSKPVLAGAAASVSNTDTDTANDGNTKAFARPAIDGDDGRPSDSGMTRLGSTPPAAAWPTTRPDRAERADQPARGTGQGPGSRSAGPGTGAGAAGPAAGTHAATSTRPGQASARHSRDGGDAGAGRTRRGDQNDEYSGSRRRRWPIMTVLVALFVVLIGGGLVIGYQVVRSQYYVAPDAGKVAIFRGINDSVLGISLHSVYQLTNIPVAGVTAASAAELSKANTGSLAMAQQFVSVISKQYNTCQTARAKVASWLKNKPTHKVRKKTKVKGKIVYKLVFPAYPPEPVVPSFCPTPTSGT